MFGNILNKLITDSVTSAPEEIWKKIKFDIAKSIADEFFAKLEKQKEPKKQECMDRTNKLIISIIPKYCLKGVNNHGLF